MAVLGLARGFAALHSRSPFWCGVAALARLMLAFRLPTLYKRYLPETIDRLLAAGRGQGILGLKEICISSAEITAKRMVETTTVHGPGVRRIATCPSGLVVLLSGFETLVIPRRAFAAPEGFEEFAGLARRSQAEAVARAKKIGAGIKLDNACRRGTQIA